MNISCVSLSFEYVVSRNTQEYLVSNVSFEHIFHLLSDPTGELIPRAPSPALSSVATAVTSFEQ